LKLQLVVVLIAASILPVISARAEGDGYFCNTKGYLAMEHYSLDPNSVAEHHSLSVVRFGPNGISPPADITINDFSVERMDCEPDHVEISGWSWKSKLYDQYVIEVPATGSLRISQYEQTKEGWQGNREGFSPESIRFLEVPEWNLVSTDAVHAFVLVRNMTEAPIEHGIEYHITAEIRELASNGRVLQTLEIYDGFEHEFADGGEDCLNVGSPLL
jgi:hypothetical protein